MKPYSQRNKILERFRFRIADILNNSAHLCWADLAMFGLGYGIKKLFSNSKSCRKESEDLPCKMCYCGKFYDGKLVTKELSDQWVSESEDTIDTIPF